MTRRFVLGALLAAGILSLTVAAYQAPPAPMVVEVEKLKDNLFMLKGGGGNTAVFITANGVVVVDTKNPGWGQPIIAKIKELTNKPVTTIVNTHTHGDHVSGNVEFPATVDIVVQENTRANMVKMIPATGQPPAPNIFEGKNGLGTAKRTFKDRMTIGSGNDRVELYYFGRGHTNGDAWVVFPSARVAHAGDIFSGKNLPLIDANNGGSGVDIGNTLAKAADGIPNVDSFITGHSTVMSVADLREYAQFNRDFLADVQSGISAGKSPDAIASGWKINGKYKGYAIAPDRLNTNVGLVAAELKK
jgi:glyoxylase-like metal-dependent hydrolase (beta-lactamase superfamily II)